MMRRLLSLLLPLLLLCAAQAQAATRVVKVIDGDTFVAEGVGKVRVLGIDTPESAHMESPVEPFGEQARQRTQALLSGTTVTLLPDQEPTDRYGRTLAHVTLNNGEDLAEILLREGLAMVYFFPPNLSRVRLYQELEEKARRKGLGIWSPEGGRRIPHDAAGLHLERVRVVTGTALAVAERGDWIYLNFGPDYRSDFTASIQRRDWERHFPANTTAARLYQGRAVEVRGRIHSRNGPNIQVYHPNQIRMVTQGE